MPHIRSENSERKFNERRFSRPSSSTARATLISELAASRCPASSMVSFKIRQRQRPLSTFEFARIFLRCGTAAAGCAIVKGDAKSEGRQKGGMTEPGVTGAELRWPAAKQPSQEPRGGKNVFLTTSDLPLRIYCDFVSSFSLFNELSHYATIGHRHYTMLRGQ